MESGVFMILEEMEISHLGHRTDLHNNKLTGPIPSQTKRLKRLKVTVCSLCSYSDIVYFSFNSFKGETPTELAALPLASVPVLQQVHWKHSFCAIAHIPKLTFLLLGESQMHSASILSSKKCTFEVNMFKQGVVTHKVLEVSDADFAV
ncbi:hypothetical protein IGI04_008512 [Brassica rapa subsp. trilocularis]|uniref:FBD domain-containing protein n=1 Tax=Brassica rapa subsp. trilocularis TaxID=1813537 RepID=A0ABQ7NMT9_BRACM|nr:hypothetical protein IGI04_008512 [Brassica rapa subsp. trilocularis]